MVLIIFAAAVAAFYHVQSLTGSHPVSSTAQAISAVGEVAGRIGNDAFTWQNGRISRYPAIDFMHNGDFHSAVATGVNRAGVAVGHEGTYQPLSMSGLELATAAIFRAGKTIFLNDQDNATFEALGINDRGEIVGARAYRGFYRDALGSMHEIAPLSNRDEYNGTVASALDNERHVVGGTTIDVGRSFDDVSQYPVHAFLLTISAGDQHMQDLGRLLAYPDTIATAINEDLTVVGYSGTSTDPKHAKVSGPSHAWVWQRGHMTDLGALDLHESSYAFGINDASTIVGCSGDSAVRWVNKKIQDLNTLVDTTSGWRLNCAIAINRSGWIVGEGTYKGVRQAFLLTPR
jgi:probable HAF family extracellular repeat protein